GGSAAAEIHALRHVFGDGADKIVIANTKGLTGHAMGAGVEDVLAVKALETGVVPPVANFKEVDPELGTLNLSKGGAYPVEYALRLGAGFGSQISMTLLRWITTKDGVRRNPNALGYAYRVVDPNAWNAWLSRMAGRPAADLEVVHRTLRVRDQARDKVGDQGAARIAEPASELRAAAPVPTPQAMAPAPVVNTRPPDKKPATAPVSAATPPPAKVQAAVTAPPVPAPRPPAAKTESEVTTSASTPTPSNKDYAADPVKERILALVAEKTGYPQDMLDLDLDLEADLGVDTVKQAEMFAGIREIYNIPRDENRKLRDYPTLTHVIRFVYDKRPDLAVAAPVAATPKATEKTEPIAPAPAAAPPAVPLAAPGKDGAGDSVKERILALVVEKTGYPQDMLDLDLDLEADLGVDTVKQAEMFAAIRAAYNIPRDETVKLRDYPTLAHVIRFVYERRPDLSGAAPSAPAVAEPPAPAPSPVTPTDVSAAQSPTNVITDDSIKEKVLEIVAEKTG